MTTTPHRTDWFLWLWWMLSNTLAWAIAIAFFFWLGTLLLLPLTLSIPLVSLFLYLGIAGLAAGTVIGIVQSWLLRRSLPFVTGWVLATAWSTALGLVLLYLLITIFSDGLEVAFLFLLNGGGLAGGAITGAALGIVVGFAQRRLLRPFMPMTEWWLRASIAGWMMGIALVRVTLDYVFAEVVTTTALSILLMIAGGGAAGGLLYGAISGIVLVRLVETTL